MSIYHLLNAMHSYYKITNVFVAILPAAACSLRSMNWCVVIELLVWLLICCVLIELLCRYWTNKKENWFLYGGSYLLQKYSSLHSRSLNNICTVAIPGQILARLWCSWRAVKLFHRLHSPQNPKPQPGHFNNSPTRRPRSEKPLQTLGSRRKLSANLRHYYCE